MTTQINDTCWSNWPNDPFFFSNETNRFLLKKYVQWQFDSLMGRFPISKQ